MSKLQFDVISPEQLLYSGEPEQVDLPGEEGDFGVLAGHVPCIAKLRPGIVTIYCAGDRVRLVIGVAIAEVTPHYLNLLANYAVAYEDVDLILLAQQIKDAEEDVADAAEGASRDHAQRRLEHLYTLRAAMNAQTI
jgi:F-type H+-transporting ATPase subunit epsilon